MIANRGEIAVRIIRACRNLGIRSVAVYSKEDAKSLHVQLADQRICIGEGPARNSYLNMDRIIAAAENMGADAIHPGFGFLSENSEFVRKCKENGITFIGPDADVIDKMGNKSHARKTMMDAGVPVVPGTKEPVYDAETGKKLAEEIGYPVMIKASSGGGGKGMRVAANEDEFEFQFNMAQRESANAFGDDTMYIERFVENPRHVEIQIMADSHGNVVALGERDCSVQRNHQKLIEESPSPAIDEETRRKMNEYAVLAAKTVGYTNAGTIEFIVDPKGNFYFMEMNTRIQMGQLQRQYIIEEERSFTIIAFPIPEVGDCFEELFRETIQINTLDYKKYQRIQQTIIDALDQADHCEIKGCNGNHTDLKVNLWKLKNPAKETIFENCVADVNIPVGEVFTSPVLEGTNGVLHVTRVFLNGLEYKDLEITFENGKIQNYNCANFATEEENKAFIKENILFRHKTLPLGEFAIGTNTTAYVAAKKLGVESKMPILIAEKMGPHFAVGDTCYSHAEEVKVYNPDGKEIVARDNEVAALRSVNPSKAYFNCHTDITIPYDELAELTAVKKDGDRITIIRNGRFVLPGTEELNEPLQELS